MHRSIAFPCMFLLALLGGCTEIPENNDPVIGIWTQLQAPKEASAKHMDREEWIFNDAYMGRYHSYRSDEIVVETDFQWKARDGVYTVSYPGLVKGDDQVKIKESPDGTMLINLEGQVLAYRE